MKKNDLTKAVQILRQGGLVAIPTETVYGLGADARNLEAVRKIFHAKQRPMDHPLIVHLADVSQLLLWARDVPEAALLLANTFWPGPLTLILKKADDVNDILTGGQDTVGLRIPQHPIALQLLKEFGGGIAAPSANRFGRISPTTADAVREELGDAVDLILEGGQCEVGVESTIVDMSQGYPVILRPGMISADQIKNVLHTSVREKNIDAPRVSGSHLSHYAPSTKTCLMTAEQIKQFLQTVTEKDKPLALISLTKTDVKSTGILQKNMPCEPNHYAHDLYQTLRDLDKQHFKQILIEMVPDDREWDAIRDRLKRATCLF